MTPLRKAVNELQEEFNKEFCKYPYNTEINIKPRTEAILKPYFENLKQESEDE